MFPVSSEEAEGGETAVPSLPEKILDYLSSIIQVPVEEPATSEAVSPSAALEGPGGIDSGIGNTAVPASVEASGEGMSAVNKAKRWRQDRAAMTSSTEVLPEATDGVEWVLDSQDGEGNGVGISRTGGVKLSESDLRVTRMRVEELKKRYDVLAAH